MKDMVEINGLSVAYRRVGKGPALVLLHGFLCDSRVWRHQLSELSDAFTVVAWDAPGAGSSADPPETFTIVDWARCLEQLLDACEVERASLVGLSWGGMLAQELYRLHPERVHRLILADTYAGWKGSFGVEVAEQRLERCVRESSLTPDEFVARWVPVEFFTEGVSQEVAREMAAVVSDFHPLGFRLMAKTLAETDTTDLLPKIDVPTLLLWGDGDLRSPLSVAEQFRQAIPNADLAVIPSAGHVSNMEKPAEFNAHVRRFLSETGPSPAA
jgi:pimeloyl-ACP methyl ester carboxylesterase